MATATALFGASLRVTPGGADATNRPRQCVPARRRHGGTAANAANPRDAGEMSGLGHPAPYQVDVLPQLVELVGERQRHLDLLHLGLHAVERRE